MKRVLSPSFVRTAPKPKGNSGESIYQDSQCQGFALRVSPGGARSYVFLWQEKETGGKYRKNRLRLDNVSSAPFDPEDATPVYGVFVNGEELADVRTRIAQPMRLRVQKGLPPLPDLKAQLVQAENAKFENVLQRFLALYSPDRRTLYETKRVFDVYVLPDWKGLSITDIRRSTVSALLDKVQTRKAVHPKTGKLLGGPVQVDHVLAQIRKLFNWYATRDDDFITPIVRGMARTKPGERARTRVLTDDEIRAIWKLLPLFGVFGAIIKALFLTAQRRSEVAELCRPDIGKDGIWGIDPARYKTKKPQFVPLSKAAVEHIKGQKKIEGAESDYVFTTNGETPWNGFGGPLKAQLDAAMLVELRRMAEERGDNPAKVVLPQWQLHDIRRTAKTLMSRAGVAPHISERVLGHVIPGVEGIYDRHSYELEKRDALERLAALIEKIVSPPGANMSQLLAAE